MRFRALDLPANVAGAVWLHSMPGRIETWPQFLAEAERVQLSRIVCLNPLYEVASISPAYHAAITQGTLSLGWQHVPMRDLGLAANAQVFHAGIDQLAQAVTDGESVLLHCTAGIGRTGTAAACLLKRLGLPAAQALHNVRAAGSSPESALQSGLIDGF